MSYLPNIPTAQQTLKSSQGPINTNFTQANIAFGVDNVAFQTVTNQGMHNKVTLVSGADPTAATQGPILYSKQVTYPGPLTKNEIFFRQASTDGSLITQLTDMFTGSVTSNSPGSTFLPGGIIMKWGTSGTSGMAQSFSGAFPNNVFAVTAGIADTTGTRTVTFTIQGLTGVTLFFTGAVTAYYIAIGN